MAAMQNKALLAACKLVLDTISHLDPTGKNTERYKKFFASKTEKELLAWFQEFMKNPDDNFYIEVLPYYNEPSFKEIKSAASFLGIPLKEYVSFPDNDDMTTAYPVPVGYLLIKRQQQIVAKKNSMASSIKQRNPKTGQVVGASKAARESDMDNYSLQTVSATAAMKELLGARADDMTAKNQLYQALAREGFATQSEIESDPTNKVALKTVDMLYLCCGIKTNLISNSLVLPVVAERRKSKV